MIYRALLRAVVSLAVLAAGLVVLQAPAAAAVRGPLRYEARHALKCLDNPGSSPNNNVSIIIFQCQAPTQANQLWTEEDTGSGYVQIRNKSSNKCLTVRNASTTKGEAIIQYTCNGGSNARWKPIRVIDNQTSVDWYYLKNLNSGWCLHVKNASTANSTTLVQHDCADNGKDNNLWTWYNWS